MPENIAWGQRLLAALEHNIGPKRLAKGRQYILSHKIPEWTRVENTITFAGKNRGMAYYGMNEPIRFEGSITLSTLPVALWESVIGPLGDQAGFIIRLLLNEIPECVEESLNAAGHSLLPDRYGVDIVARCSCHETEPPCRHIAAVLCALAARLDQDPLLLFEIRGLSRRLLLNQLEGASLGGILATALTEEPEPLMSTPSYYTRPARLPTRATDINARDFWRAAKKIPACPEPPQASPVSGLLVKKGGDYPPFWEKDASFIEVMDIFYEEVRKKSGDWS